MEIHKIMASFGENNDSELVKSLVENVSIKEKENKGKNNQKKAKEIQYLNVFMDFNLDEDCISFDIIPFSESSPYDYNYFGNNASNSKQWYAVRKISSFYYYFKSLGVMKNIFEFLPQCELKELVSECEKQDLFSTSGINFAKIKFTDENNVVRIDNNNLLLNDEKISYEKFLLGLLGGASNIKLMLVIPRIIKNGNVTVISVHEDYVNAVSTSLSINKGGSVGICHICGQRKNDINTAEYTTNLSRYSISKVFVTTKINYSADFSKDGHQNNFALCKSCYEKLLAGEKKVMNDFRLKISGADCVLLFESVLDKLDKRFFTQIKSDVDAVFNPQDTDKWLKDFRNELKEQNIDLYEFSIIFYETDGKSCSVVKTIDNISSIRFELVKQVFENARLKLDGYLKYFTLGHLYRMVPIYTAKDGTQLNIRTLLDLYGSIMKGQCIDASYIFDLACQAYEKGISEFNSSTVRNYKNLYNIVQQHSSPSGRDYFIYRVAMSYIALFHALRELNILDREVFSMDDDVRDLSKAKELEHIKLTEDFLNKQGFLPEGRGLFYLGMLLSEIGTVQYKQKHEKKPIMDKLNYSGMSLDEVVALYLDLLEKQRQYVSHINLMICESIMTKFHEYLGNLQSAKLFKDKENLFFIMAGYAYSIGCALKNGISKKDKDEIEYNEIRSDEDDKQ